jgi:hypothetical protein
VQYRIDGPRSLMEYRKKPHGGLLRQAYEFIPRFLARSNHGGAILHVVGNPLDTSVAWDQPIHLQNCHHLGPEMNSGPRPSSGNGVSVGMMAVILGPTECGTSAFGSGTSNST